MHYGQNDLFQLAGVLAERIILNHAFHDGNKRAALLAAGMLLKMDGSELFQEKEPLGTGEANDGLADARIATAANRWTAEGLGAYYRSIAKPPDRVAGRGLTACGRVCGA